MSCSIYLLIFQSIIVCSSTKEKNVCFQYDFMYRCTIISQTFDVCEDKRKNIERKREQNNKKLNIDNYWFSMELTQHELTIGV